MDDMPAVPDTSPVLDAVVALHEIFVTLLEGGFNERQALVIVAEMVRPRNDSE